MPCFWEFVRGVIDGDRNEHWCNMTIPNFFKKNVCIIFEFRAPVSEWCEPCRVRYDNIFKVEGLKNSEEEGEHLR